MYRYLAVLLFVFSFNACTENFTQVSNCRVEITRSPDGKILSRKILSCENESDASITKSRPHSSQPQSRSENTQQASDEPAFGKHTAFGFPQGHPSSNKLIKREIYVLSNNSRTKFADWVAYKVTTSTIGRSKKRVWRPDPELSDPDTLEPPDYKGANRSLRTDRGHQVPLASFAGTPHWHETNYLSNITPQSSSLNQGSWVKLESKVRDLTKTYDAVYVMSGPLYQKKMRPLPGADESHEVPSGYWKIIIVQAKNGSLPYKMSAFLFPQDAERGDHYCKYHTAVDNISSASGLTFPRIGEYKNSLNRNPYLLCSN